jgi:hypothetical protein
MDEATRTLMTKAKGHLLLRGEIVEVIPVRDGESESVHDTCLCCHTAQTCDLLFPFIRLVLLTYLCHVTVL